MSTIRLSDKAIDFIRYPSRIDVLEGGGRTGKTTAALIKFGIRVNASNRKQFMIAGADTVVVRRNVVTNDMGFLDLFRGYAREGTKAENGSHIIFTDSRGRNKIIYLAGFKDKSRWSKILGSTLGGLLGDEINLADPDFIAQAKRSLASVDDAYMVVTLNPSNPSLPIYSEFIDRSRPAQSHVSDVPRSILQCLRHNELTPEDGSVYWHFDFADNPVMTPDKIERFRNAYPVGSFFYRSLILGERGVAEGSVFGELLSKPGLDASSFDDRVDGVWQDAFTSFRVGIDLGNGQRRKGSVLSLVGITRAYKDVIVLDSHPCVSREANLLAEEISQTIIRWYDFIGAPSKFGGCWMDSYGAIEILLSTVRNRMTELGRGNIAVDPCVKFGEQGGRSSRLMLLLLLMGQARIKFEVNQGAQEMREQLKRIVYDPKTNLPLDNNQEENDYYDALCYAITPDAFRLNRTLKI